MTKEELDILFETIFIKPITAEQADASAESKTRGDTSAEKMDAVAGENASASEGATPGRWSRRIDVVIPEGTTMTRWTVEARDDNNSIYYPCPQKGGRCALQYSWWEGYSQTGPRTFVNTFVNESHNLVRWGRFAVYYV